MGLGAGRKGHMIIKKMRLKKVRDELERLTDFIKEVEGRNLPYFYRYFDTMKNNIDLFLCIGDDDIDSLHLVLERDWKASHATLLGVQDYDLRESNPDIDPRLCFYFARLISEVGSYFEQKQESHF